MDIEPNQLEEGKPSVSPQAVVVNGVALSTSGVIETLAKYFMTFLETDFKKRRLPKRNTKSFAVKGNKVGYELERYPELKKLVMRNFGKTNDELTVTVKAGQYVSKMPAQLLAFINERVDDVDNEIIEALIKDILKAYSSSKGEHLDNYEDFLTELKDDVSSSISSLLVGPLIEDVKRPLVKAGVSQQSGIYRLQTDIREHVFALIEEGIDQFAPKYFASKEPKPILEQVKKDSRETLTESALKDLLRGDFEDFATHDCYKDLYQLSRSLQLIDKTELYLYLFDLEIDLENRDSFPLFYVPVHMDHSDNEYTLTFDNRVFVNTKGFEFVCQEYSSKINSPVTPDKFDRILYGEADNGIRDKLERILGRVSQTLDLDAQLDLKTTSITVASTEHVSLSNALSFYVFDKSDEALINDYEEILNNEGELSELFAELLQSFLSENPRRFDDAVDVDWDNLGIPEKLLTESPIPLNEEQKKVVMALGRDDCKVLILEGPPGTGKSHTITSVICQAVLEGKSILVLSDKKEALDVVEDKISSTLNKVRTDEAFQNPILRLGAMGKGIGKVVDGAVLNSIKHHHSTYRKNESYAEDQYNELLDQTKHELDQNTTYYSDLTMADLKDYFDVAEKYDGYEVLFKGFEMPLSEDRINTLLDVLKRLRDVQREDEGMLRLAKAYPGVKLLSDVEKMHSEYADAARRVNDKLVRSINHLLSSKNVSVAELQRIVTLAEEITDAAKTELGDAVVSMEKDQNFNDLAYQLEFSQGVVKAGARIYEYLAPSKNRKLSSLFNSIVSDLAENPHAAYEDLSSYITSLQSLKSILGFAGKRGQIETLTLKLRQRLPGFQLANPEKSLSDLIALRAILEFGIGIVAENYENDKNILSHALTFCSHLVEDYGNLELANAIAENITELSKLYSKTDSAFNELPFSRSQNINEAIDLKTSRLHLIAEADKYSSFFTLLDPTLESVATVEDLQQALSKYGEQNATELEGLAQDIGYVQGLMPSEKEFLDQLQISIDLSDLEECSHPIIDLPKHERAEMYTFLRKHHELTHLFTDAPNDEYLEEQSAIEYLNTAKMAYMLDKHILDYTTGRAAELQTLRGLLKKKQKFPQSLFGNLKQAFPCILAGIRDYAEYIPLEKDLFDLIIIDEASQVSIAQALPAFIRGKKILILGDDKQFSNVKAGNASTERNQYFKHELLDVFRSENAGLDDLDAIEPRIRDNFDVKRSVLDFSRFISNYVVQLKKHFRCYPEIISYSNEHFYKGSLECVKLRAVPISEVIKFDVLEHDGRQEKFAKTNTLEAQFILETLTSWRDKDEKKSVGIITPHTEQARIIAETLQGSDIWNWLEKECSIKIMTFDTCQGEERDYILYSMVASPVSDRLSWIFAADFSGTQDYEQRLNAQRMNVGFSRAKNTIHFVLSKPIVEFRGEIQKALKHYQTQLDEAVDIHLGGTDSRSPMEKKIQKWLYETKFYKDHNDLEITPQFPIGQYLKYIDPDYSHPNYKVDFLLVLGKDTIVLEYDGFKEHFESLDEVDATNYRSYQKPDDYYRQKVLESYGYRFLRVNKFNLGDDPVTSLDEMLAAKFKKKSFSPTLIDELKINTKLLAEGVKRTCDHCEEVYDASEFPYKTVNLCYRCYRTVKGRNVQRKFIAPKSPYSEQLKEYQERAINILGYDPVTEQTTKAPEPEEVFRYLRRRTNARKSLEFRYKSARENSDKQWRVMKRYDFDRSYFWDLDTKPSYKYRIDRVVEFKE